MAFISPDQSVLIFAVLIFAVAVGILGDQNRWFGKVSGVLVTIAIAAAAASLDIIPSASDPNLTVPAYDLVFNYFIPLSIPLLLFDVHLKKILQKSGRLLAVFLIGSFGVSLGGIIAFFLISFGPETYKVAAAFIGTYTGGSVNFMAVSASFDFLDSSLFPTVITIDNVFTNLFFMLLFLLPALGWLAGIFEHTASSSEQMGEHEPEENGVSQLDMDQIIIPLLISFVIFGTSITLSSFLQKLLQTEMTLDILIITILITILANSIPKWMSRYASSAFMMGMSMMYVFLAVIGASCDVMTLLQTSGSMVLFVTIILSVHLVVILIGGKLLGVPLEEILIASAANAGGPAISAPMAVNFGKHHLVTPAILVGIMGYLIGTFLGVGVGLLLH